MASAVLPIIAWGWRRDLGLDAVGLGTAGRTAPASAFLLLLKRSFKDSLQNNGRLFGVEATKE